MPEPRDERSERSQSPPHMPPEPPAPIHHWPVAPFPEWPRAAKAEALQQLSFYARLLSDTGHLHGQAHQLIARLEAAARNIAFVVDAAAVRGVRNQPWVGLPAPDKVARLRQISHWANEEARRPSDVGKAQRNEVLALARHTEGLAHILDFRERERDRAAR